MNGWSVRPGVPVLDVNWGTIAGYPGWRYVVEAGLGRTGCGARTWTRGEE
jgi:hypothetical protein